MQDINQQLYERKETPEGFIPVYAVVCIVDNIYSTGTKEFTSDISFDEAKNRIINGASIIVTDGKNIFNFNSISYYVEEGNSIIGCTGTYNSVRSITLIWKLASDGTLTKNVISEQMFAYDNFVEPYNIGNIVATVISGLTAEDVLMEINDIFTNFVTFASRISEPHTVMYSTIHGKYYTNVANTKNTVIIQWSDSTMIHHISIQSDGSYTYNTIQIADQTLYRLSTLTIEPITNPKIWVGTATQYAAIAVKDSNTTYIVKSDA